MRSIMNQNAAASNVFGAARNAAFLRSAFTPNTSVEVRTDQAPLRVDTAPQAAAARCRGLGNAASSPRLEIVKRSPWHPEGGIHTRIRRERIAQAVLGAIGPCRPMASRTRGDPGPSNSRRGTPPGRQKQRYRTLERGSTGSEQRRIWAWPAPGPRNRRRLASPFAGGS